MKLIVDIDEAIYKRCKKSRFLLTNDRVAVENAIADSVPLDKLNREPERCGEENEDDN